MEFSNLTRAMICSMLPVFFILPERNLAFENLVSGSKEEVVSPINYCFNFKWGSEGSLNGKFLHPHDVNFDSIGNVYVSDRDGKFNHPHGIDVDSNGYVYVNELENPRIQKFDENGTFVKQWGSEGKGEGEFTPLLEHLEVDPRQDMIFMVDGAHNPRIQVFDNDGNFATSFGTSGSGDGQFSKPEHVNIDSSGNVYVVDRGNQRTQVFSPC